MEVHRDSISQSGSCLGNVKVHSFTLSYTLGSMWCDSRVFSWLAPLQPLGLGRKPKGRVATGTHSNCIVKCFFPTCFGQSSYLKVVYKVYQPILVILEILCPWHNYRKLGNMFYVLNFNVAKLEIITKITRWTCRGAWHGFPLDWFPFVLYYSLIMNPRLKLQHSKWVFNFLNDVWKF